MESHTAYSLLHPGRAASFTLSWHKFRARHRDTYRVKDLAPHSQTKRVFCLAILAAILALILSACDKFAPSKVQSTRTLGELDAAVKRLEQDRARWEAALKRLEEDRGNWILWRSSTPLDVVQLSLDYRPEGAIGDKSGCEAVAEHWVAQQARVTSGQQNGLSFQVTDPKVGRIVYTYMCLLRPLIHGHLAVDSSRLASAGWQAVDELGRAMSEGVRDEVEKGQIWQVRPLPEAH